MRIVFAFGLAMALSLSLGVHPAKAGKTLLEKEYVGSVENKDRVGGDLVNRHNEVATDVAARFAGSNNSIAEGPPPGHSVFDQCDPSAQDPNAPGCAEDISGNEAFVFSGTLPVIGASSPNGYSVQQNIPTCTDAGQNGLPARYGWIFRLERPVVSDLQIQICLDVRKCQEEQDVLGQAATVPIPDFVDFNGWEAPVIIRVQHLPGELQFNPPFGLRNLLNLTNPGLFPVEHVIPADLDFDEFFQEPIPDLPRTTFPAEAAPLLSESVAFVGKDCITKTVFNDGLIAARDFIGVELLVPSSTRVRVRASQDSAAVCYVGTPLPGEQL